MLSLLSSHMINAFSPKQLHSLFQASFHKILQTCIATNSDWQPLTNIALHFVSLGTSEADVERRFSIQRDIRINKTRQNLSTIKARMILRLHEQQNDDDDDE